MTVIHVATLSDQRGSLSLVSLIANWGSMDAGDCAFLV